MRILLTVCAFWASLLAPGVPVHAQDGAVVIPRFRTAPVERAPAQRDQKRVVRFLTASDFPPFQFIAADGNPAGFNVDLARAICTRLDFPCTIQALPWSDLLGALESGRADALIAGMRPTAELGAKAELSRPYFRLPARFVSRREDAVAPAPPRDLAGKTVAVVSGSAHEAFIKAFFPGAVLAAEPNAQAARAALKEKRADLLFGDGASLSLWLGGTESANCCAFVPGAYTESRFFGEGMVIASRKGDARLRQQLDRALDELESTNATGDLYLRWFPIGIF
jgi:polar amino acid transport system substrate-binding protein